MTPLQLWQASVREKLGANADYVEKFKFAVRSKTEMIGQTSALLMIAQERIADLTTALAVIDTLTEALEWYVNIKEPLAGVARSALEHANALVEGK